MAFCPTHNMLGDFLTKHLQGNYPVQMRDKILYLPGSTHTAMHRSLLKKANLHEAIKVDEKKSSKPSSEGLNQIKRLDNNDKNNQNLGLEKDEKQGHTDQLIISNFIRLLKFMARLILYYQQYNNSEISWEQVENL